MLFQKFTYLVLFVFLALFNHANVSAQTVLLETSEGDITIKLESDKAPLTVANFLAYVEKGFYPGTIFHRVIDGFMIQGGGLDKDMNRKSTLAPVVNESMNGLKNQRGTLAMARTQHPDSATSQFFINLVDNAFLDGKPQRPGYAVFATVVSGMDVVDRIAKVATGSQKGHANVPVKPIVIQMCVSFVQQR